MKYERNQIFCQNENLATLRQKQNGRWTLAISIAFLTPSRLDTTANIESVCKRSRSPRAPRRCWGSWGSVSLAGSNHTGVPHAGLFSGFQSAIKQTVPSKQKHFFLNLTTKQTFCYELWHRVDCRRRDPHQKMSVCSRQAPTRQRTTYTQLIIHSQCSPLLPFLPTFLKVSNTMSYDL